MKKTGLIAKSLLLGAFITLSVIANAMEPAPKNPANAVQKSIKDYFRFPAFVSPFPSMAAEKVEVLFSTGSDSKVNFVLAKTPNLKLKSEIEQQFSGMKLPQLNANVVHSVVLAFKSI